MRLSTALAVLMLAGLLASPSFAAISVDVAASVGPVGNDVKLSEEAESPNSGTYYDRAVEYMETGSTTTGDPSVNPAAFQPVTETTSPALIATPGFKSWRGQANPTGLFSEEHGNMLYFHYRIKGDGSTTFKLENLQFEVESSDPDNSFGFSGDYTEPEINGYSDHRIGINWGSDRQKGGGDDIRYTSGNASTSVDEIVSIGVGVFKEPSGSGSNQDMIDNTWSSINDEAGSTITGAYGMIVNGIPTSDSSTVTLKQTSIPEPATASLVAIGASLMLWRRRVQ